MANIPIEAMGDGGGLTPRGGEAAPSSNPARYLTLAKPYRDPDGDAGFWSGLVDGSVGWERGQAAEAHWWNLFTGHSKVVETVRFAGALALLVHCSTSGKPITKPLRPREIELMDRTARAERGNSIAIDLGISDALLCLELKAGLRRLGLESRAELVWFCRERDGLGPPSTLRAAANVSGEWVVSVASMSAADITIPLTPAEHFVASALLAGQATETIAEMRGTSPTTVANQIARLFAKLRTSGRCDLILQSRDWAKAAPPPERLPGAIVEHFASTARSRRETALAPA